MPTIEEIAEPSSLAAAAKLHFNPPPAPREVVHEPKEPAPAEPAAREPAAKPATKEPAKATVKPEPPVKPAAAVEKPEDEAATVFGTAPAKVKPDTTPKDEDFETKLTDEKKGMTEKAGAKWEQLRRSEKAAQAEARQAREELKAGIEAREAKEPVADAPKLEAATARIAALELQLAEAEKSLSVTAFERSRKYQREVKEPMGELTKSVEDMAARYELSPKTILAALEEDPKTRSDTLAEIAADFKEGDRIDLYSIAKDMDRLRRKSDSLREKAKSDLSALEQEDRDTEARETAETRQTFSASVLRTWDEAARTLDFLRHHDAAPEWNAALDNARRQSESYMPGADPIADGQMIARAHEAPFLVKALDHYRATLATITEERDTLLARIESDNAHDPGLGGARDDAADDGGDEDEGLSLGARTKAAAARMK